MNPPLPASTRRRNRRLGLLLAVLAVLSAVWTPYATRHGWIQPIETTFAFPHWMK